MFIYNALHNSRYILSAVVAGLSLIFLVGCNTFLYTAPVNFKTQPLSASSMQPSQIPEYHVGDKFYYSNGARDTITAIDEDDVEITNKYKRKSVYSHNLFMPYKFLETKTKTIIKNTTAQTNRLWPLSPGGWDRYKSESVSVGKESGQEKKYTQYWRCEVEAAERITIVAGVFDTYPVTCKRVSLTGKPYQIRTWFYSPELQTYVLRRDTYVKPIKVRFRELTAVRPSLSHLLKKDRNGIIRTWQHTLENTVSNQTISWKSKTSNISSEVMPLMTFKGENDQYCRSYRQYITENSRTRTYGGVACRTGKLKWRTPKKG